MDARPRDCPAAAAPQVEAPVGKAWAGELPKRRYIACRDAREYAQGKERQNVRRLRHNVPVPAKIQRVAQVHVPRAQVRRRQRMQGWGFARPYRKKRDRGDVQTGGEREFVHAMWDKLMGSQGHSSRVTQHWKVSDLRELKACLTNAATALGVTLSRRECISRNKP
jgi:hypothetical protein